MLLILIILMLNAADLFMCLLAMCLLAPTVASNFFRLLPLPVHFFHLRQGLSSTFPNPDPTRPQNPPYRHTHLRRAPLPGNQFHKAFCHSGSHCDRLSFLKMVTTGFLDSCALREPDVKSTPLLPQLGGILRLP